MFSPPFSPYHVGQPIDPTSQMNYRPPNPPPPYPSNETSFRPPFPPNRDEFRNPNPMQNSALPPNHIKFKVFYKTKMCLKFLNGGTCPYGSTCTFAHGAEDLREPPPDWRNYVHDQGEEHNLNPSSDQEMQRINRLKICKRFYNGLPCPYGDRCTFLHHDPDVVPGSMQAEMDVKRVIHPEQFGRSSSQGGSGTILKASLLKTKLCINWEKLKECKYGERCQYAHGVSELQKYNGKRDNPLPHIQSSTRQTLPDQHEQQPSKKPCLHSLKLPLKINGIYGDWTDD